MNTVDGFEFIRKFPDKCCAAVNRNGEYEPCDKIAVAVMAGATDAWDCDEVDPHWWPACAYHVRKDHAVPLADLLQAMEQR